MTPEAQLFQSEIRESYVNAFRLVTGEEILSRVSQVTDVYVELDQPRVLLAQLRMKDGQPVMAAQIMNWVNSNPEGKVRIPYSLIATVISNPEEALEHEYIRFTTSIQLVKA